MIIYLLLLVSFSACQTTNKVLTKEKGIITDVRDGQQYGYVQIEDSYWLTENMRYNVAGSKWNPDNPDTLYGRLYNWNQAINACPDGWVLSSSSDWLVLERIITDDSLEHELLKTEQFRGNNTHLLKSKKGWKHAGIDALGLNLLPAGGARKTGEFLGVGRLAFYWTASPYIPKGFGEIMDELAMFRNISDKKEGVWYDSHWKEKNYYSCRCVQYPLDKADKKVAQKRYTFTDPRDGQEYGYVQIKDYYWMTENMRYNAAGSMWNPANPDTLYGRLYDKYQAALEVCPEGWMLSNTAAWMNLESSTIDLYRGEMVFNNRFRGKNVKVLKSTRGWEQPGTNDFGLNLLPAGKADMETGFSMLGEGAYFWLFNSLKADFKYCHIHKDASGIYKSKTLKDEEEETTNMSCRCVKYVGKK